MVSSIGRFCVALTCLLASAFAESVTAQTPPPVETLPSSPAEKAELSAMLARLVEKHPLAQASQHDVNAADDLLRSERGHWFPRLSVRAGGGSQKIERDIGEQGRFRPTEVSLQLNQLVWDFGALNGAIAVAEKSLAKEVVGRETQTSNLLYAGIEAYQKLARAQRVVELTRQSENNIARQAQLENARIEIGKGYASDLVQIRAQLAGASARRVAAEGALDVALNRFQAVFDAPRPPRMLPMLAVPTGLPNTIDDVDMLIDRGNPDLRLARSRAELVAMRRDMVSDREWMPKLELLGEKSRRREFDGVEGRRDDTRLAMQLSWNFDTGLRADALGNAAGHDAIAENERARYAQTQAREEGRNAWFDYLTSRQRMEHLKEQADNSRKFLELVRKERELGRRSLIDVITAETNLINAESDKVAAETDLTLSAFRLVRGIGRLDLPTARSMLGGG